MSYYALCNPERSAANFTLLPTRSITSLHSNTYNGHGQPADRH